MRKLRLIEGPGYLAALVDGEGCIGLYSWRRGRKTITRRIVTIGMCDAECIDVAALIMNSLGIKFSRSLKKPGKDRTRSLHVVSISSEAALRRFAETIPIQHAGKRRRLQQAIASFDEVRAKEKRRRAAAAEA